jgi:hypothetical protein
LQPVQTVSNPCRPMEEMEPGSRVQPVRVRASREFIRPQINQAQIDQAQIDQAVPSVTSTVCGAPPSRM